ncbi:glycosyltransferase [Lewinella sp. JB7]|uniref:glycosyltransferase n=1 Tax=Lewinella sp. JB7 TaxID=2962887 RepID=UPI0020CA13C0|nr:glycosyltransferase [Lewinella sp. JB7]MCP9236383.1 glycosyltransferase [Lewinella sp. JB7]
MELIIVTPVYNDWESLARLLVDLDHELGSACAFLHVVAVNDGSPITPDWGVVPDRTAVHVVNLTTNQGHQRAILIGLCYVAGLRHSARRIIVMDCDGEDRPADVPRLLTASEATGNRVVFAGRRRRSEDVTFRLGYLVYRSMFRLFSGKRIRFGNFSCLPVDLLLRITNDPNFWNHYSAAMIKSNVQYTVVQTDRGRRYAGRSHMNADALILHGMSALSLFVDRIVVKLFRFLAIVVLSMVVVLLTIIYVRTFTDLAIPGWASLLFAAVFNVVVTTAGFAFLVLLQQLNRRSQKPHPPVGFYKQLIYSVDHLGAEYDQ